MLESLQKQIEIKKKQYVPTTQQIYTVRVYDKKYCANIQKYMCDMHIKTCIL